MLIPVLRVQPWSLSRGLFYFNFRFRSPQLTPSCQYEIISNPETVDLLVSIAYTAAADHSLGEPLPLGMGLRVPVPDARKCVETPTYSWVHPGTPAVAAPVHVPPTPGPDGLCEFDEMGILEVGWGLMDYNNCADSLMSDACLDCGDDSCPATCADITSLSYNLA